MHGPGNSSEECKFLREYTNKRYTQHTCKDKQSRSDGNKRGKTVKFENASEEAKIMKSHDETIQKNKRRKKQKKKLNSDQANVDPSQDGNIYGIDCMNLGEPEQDS